MSQPDPIAISGLDPGKLMAAALSSTPVSSPAFAWVPPAVAEVAPWFPDYELQALIGRGAMGAVYRAVQRKLERPVAIKLLPPEIAAREGAAARFEREARAMAQLQHPNIVALHDYGRTAEGHLFIVMEYVDGADLSRLIHAESGGLSVPHALEIVDQVCDALQYAHSRGFVHRDIKPGNVLVDKDGRVKIADFGLAKLVARHSDVESAPDGHSILESRATLTGQALGTPDYTAPEQLKGAPVDHRADIYSLGVMLYEMLTGDLPRGAWTPPSQRTAAPARLDEVVTRAMQTEPDKRYQQASEVKAAAVGPAPSAPHGPGASRSAVNRVLLLLMTAFIIGACFITPTGDAFTTLMLAAPFIALAVYFKLKRRPAGLVAVLLAGMAMGAAIFVAVLQFDEFEQSHRASPEAAVRIETIESQAGVTAGSKLKEEDHAGVILAAGRAAVLTSALRNFVSACGAEQAASEWRDQSAEIRYGLLKGYAAYSPATLAEFTPEGFQFLLPADVSGEVQSMRLTEMERMMMPLVKPEQMESLMRAIEQQRQAVETARTAMLEAAKKYRIVDLALPPELRGAVEDSPAAPLVGEPELRWGQLEYGRLKQEWESARALLDTLLALKEKSEARQKGAAQSSPSPPPAPGSSR